MPIRIDQLDMLDKLKLDDRRMKFICTFYDHSIGLAPPDDWVKNILNDARAWQTDFTDAEIAEYVQFFDDLGVIETKRDSRSKSNAIGWRRLTTLGKIHIESIDCNRY